MTRIVYLLLVTSLVIPTVNSCDNNPTSSPFTNSTYSALISSPVLTVAPGAGSNLLTNSAFKVNGNPSLIGWSSNDTAGITVESFDKPPGIGTNSMRLKNYGAYGETFVTGISGHEIVRLSYWAKVPRQPYQTALFASLVQTRDGLGQLSEADQSDTWSFLVLIFATGVISIL